MITCNFCKNEITPSQMKVGFYQGGKAWSKSRGDYISLPCHRQCHFPSLIISEKLVPVYEK